MKDDEEFKKALADKQVPILVLDEKWHRLFAVHGKPDECFACQTGKTE